MTSACGTEDGLWGRTFSFLSCFDMGLDNQVAMAPNYSTGLPLIDAFWCYADSLAYLVMKFEIALGVRRAATAGHARCADGSPHSWQGRPAARLPLHPSRPWRVSGVEPRRAIQVLPPLDHGPGLEPSRSTGTEPYTSDRPLERRTGEPPCSP